MAELALENHSSRWGILWTPIYLCWENAQDFVTRTDKSKTRAFTILV